MTFIAPPAADVVVCQLPGGQIGNGRMHPIRQPHGQPFDFKIIKLVLALHRGGQSPTIARGTDRGGIANFCLDGNRRERLARVNSLQNPLANQLGIGNASGFGNIMHGLRGICL